jgi:hypothetical protein
MTPLRSLRGTAWAILAVLAGAPAARADLHEYVKMGELPYHLSTQLRILGK